MSIINTFPTTIANGQVEDATVVMSLFSWIQSQTNGNACPATTGSAMLKGNGAGGTISATAGTDYAPAIPSGMLFDFAGGAVPTGYLGCDGSAVSRTTYAALFAAIGTVWGVGDGSTTFNVPDLRRRATIGSGGTVVSGPANTVGAVGGEEAHVLTIPELATHSHVVNITDPGHNHGLNDPGHSHQIGAGSASTGLPGFSNSASTGASGTSTTGVTVQVGNTGITASSNNTGTGTAHNNMPPSAVVVKIIKT